MNSDRELRSAFERRLSTPPERTTNWGEIEMKIKKDHRNRMVAASALAMAFIATAALAVPRLGSPAAQFTTGGNKPVVERITGELMGADVNDARMAAGSGRFVMTPPYRDSVVQDALTGKTDPLIPGGSSAAVDPARGRIYVASRQWVLVYDATTLRRIGAIKGQFGHVAVDHTTGRVYATEVVQQPQYRIVSLDVESFKVTKRGEVVAGIGGFDSSKVVSIGVLLAATGGRVFAAAQTPNRVWAYDGETLALAGETAIGRMVHAIAASPETNRIALLSSTDMRPTGEDWETEDIEGTDAVQIIDAKTLRLRTVPVPRRYASGLTFDSSGERLFTAAGRDLISIDTRAGRVAGVERLFAEESAWIELAYDGKTKRLGALFYRVNEGTLVTVRL